MRRCLVNSRRREIAAGVILGAAIATFSEFVLPNAVMKREFLALVLGIIAAIYVGFAIADGRPGELVIETGNALFHAVMAVAGMWVTPWFLVIGYTTHGVWDLLHHHGGVRTTVPGWYVPFCVVVDWIVALYVALRVVS
tara:strand:- start:1908 stop:2324 length:417 start_codon:yes stop_codon:yes gene_type:complete